GLLLAARRRLRGPFIQSTPSPAPCRWQFSKHEREIPTASWGHADRLHWRCPSQEAEANLAACSTSRCSSCQAGRRQSHRPPRRYEVCPTILSRRDRLLMGLTLRGALISKPQ